MPGDVAARARATLPPLSQALHVAAGRIWQAHRPLVLLVGGHAVAVPALLYSMGLERFFRGPRFTLDLLWWLAGLAVAVTLFANRQLKKRFTLERIGSALLVWAMHPILYSSFTSFKQALVHLVPYTWDATLHRWDVALHGGPAWNVAPALMQPGFLRVLDGLYLVWFPVQIAFLLGVVWAAPSAWRSRCLLAYALLWIVLGNVAALAMGAGGPCYYAHFVGGQADPYSGLWQRLRPLELSAQLAQRLVLEGTVSDNWSPFPGISAMPSLHVGVAVYLTLVCWTVPRWWLRLVGITYALLIFAASVVLGWHYAVDGYLGAAGAWGLWWLAGRWSKDAVPEVESPRC
jgi:PAP2 superfamily